MWRNSGKGRFLWGFNLSILECKFIKGRADNPVVLVLIYPYWNVNTDSERLDALEAGF